MILLHSIEPYSNHRTYDIRLDGQVLFNRNEDIYSYYYNQNGEFNNDINIISTPAGRNFLANLIKIPGIRKFRIKFRMDNEYLKVNIFKYDNFSWDFITFAIHQLIANNMDGLYKSIHIQKSDSETQNIFNTIYLKINSNAGSSSFDIFSGTNMMTRYFSQLLYLTKNSHNQILRLNIINQIGHNDFKHLITRRTFSIIKKLFNNQYISPELIYIDLNNYIMTLNLLHINAHSILTNNIDIMEVIGNIFGCKCLEYNFDIRDNG